MLVDPQIKSHISILTTASAATSKTLYSINCLLASISHHNSYRHNNIAYIKEYVKIIIHNHQSSAHISEDYA